MLKVAAEKKIQPWIQKRPMRDANQAAVDMADGKARYNDSETGANFNRVRVSEQGQL